jgi:octaprenyl-diphosphate synthase
MIRYGQDLGTAFQLIDDALDYNASADELGKNLGDDLAEGKATLPLIYAMRAGNEAQRELIRAAILEGGLGQMDQIQEIIHSTGALEYTIRKARDAANSAIARLDGIPDSEYRQALISLARLAIERRS